MHKDFERDGKSFDKQFWHRLRQIAAPDSSRQYSIGTLLRFTYPITWEYFEFAIHDKLGHFKRFILCRCNYALVSGLDKEHRKLSYLYHLFKIKLTWLIMSFFKEMEGASFCQLVQWWNTDDAPEWAESSELFLSEIAYALVQHGERGAAFLKKYTKSKDIDKRVSAIWVLADNKFIDETILEDIRDAFYSDNNKLKNAALWSYIHIGTFPLPRIEIEQMMKGTDERMAALAMVYLSYACPCETVEILREALTSSNPRQREYACDVVGDNNIIELKSYVAELLNDACKDVQDSARINLELLHE